ncbi:MAG: hypothetical protein IKS05_03295 [Oscillospiraceae bacterium]|nr:hypothetical protein [Oscillospiraceae bacterium]
MKFLVLNGSNPKPGDSANSYVCNDEIGYCPTNRPGCTCWYANTWTCFLSKNSH